MIKKIRPAILRELLINLFYGNSFNRRKNIFLNKFNVYLNIDPFSHLGDILNSNSEYEPNTIKFILDNLSKKSIFFDIGANEGFFSIITSKINTEGKTFLFEPMKDLVKVIKKNIEINNIKHFEVFNLALGEADYESKINVFPESNTGASSILRKYRFSNKTENITVHSLDNFMKLNNYNFVIDLIKIDTEGYEINIILGMENLLKNKQIKKILVDFHVGIISEDQKKRAEEFIIKHGYKKIPLHYDFTLFQVD